MLNADDKLQKIYTTWTLNNLDLQHGWLTQIHDI